MRLLALGIAAVLAAVAATSALEGVFHAGLDHPAIQYAALPATDAIVELNRRIESGAAKLQFQESTGYLRSVLDALGIPVESQMAVFSKTSFQAARITPQNPRTLFFNDSVSIGYVRGGSVIEVAAQDPRQGVIFYVLNQQPSSQPAFRRENSCLGCHESLSAMGVPGMMLRSVFPSAGGAPVYRLGQFVTDHRSPLTQRWGGWYVTGKQTPRRHLGNSTFSQYGRDEDVTPKSAPRLASLEERFEISGYLSPYSDIAALLVFEHQMRMTNLITRVGWEARAALYDDAAKGGRRESTPLLLRDCARELVDYLLLVDETPLEGRVQGSSGFTEKFSAQGPRDKRGRSLRQLDLETRLLRYPCSYMIYSEAFDALPPEMLDAIYLRIWSILSGDERDSRYQRLSAADRKAIVEILRDTKKGLPEYFRAL